MTKVADPVQMAFGYKSSEESLTMLHMQTSNTLAEFIQTSFGVEGAERLLPEARPESSSSGALILSENGPARTAVGAILCKRQFVQVISDKIGMPKDKETKEEFVKRGSAVFERQLRKALKKS